MNRRSVLFVILLTAAFFLLNEWFYRSPLPPAAPATEATVSMEEEAPLPALPEESLRSQLNETSTGESLYVLETPYQQLVISTLGGAVAELNLPLTTTQGESLVRPIRFDGLIAEASPQNARFPEAHYLLCTEGGTTESRAPQQGGYYPLFRRSLVAATGGPSTSVPPRFYGFNVIDMEDPAHIMQFHMTRCTGREIELECVEPNRRVVKTFTLPASPSATPYSFEVAVRVEGDTRGLALTSGVPEVELISGAWSPQLKYRMVKTGKGVIESLKLPDPSASYTAAPALWVSNSNGFLGVILQPLQEGGLGFIVNKVSGSNDPTRLTLVDAAHDLFPAEKYPGYEFLVPLRKSGKTARFRVFAGPYDAPLLKSLDAAFADPATGQTPQFASALSLQGWLTFISEPFAKLLLLFMRGFYAVTHSWGLAIILLTLALRLMLYPLNAWSIRSTLKMQQIAPKVQALQEKYKKDTKRIQLETVALYREHGVNPFMGCLPILIQIPFLIAMFDLLKSTFALRGASFLLRGWIPSLTAPDVVFSWSYPLPFFGNTFHILPLVLGMAMWAQQYLSSGGAKDPSKMSDQQRQQRAMGNLMVLVFTVMFYHFPSGLNLYWLSSILLGMAQQWWMQRRAPRAPTVTVLKR